LEAFVPNLADRLRAVRARGRPSWLDLVGVLTLLGLLV
jgi:hypothetical protein